MDETVPLTFRLQFEPDLMLVVRGEPRAMDLASRVRRIGYALPLIFFPLQQVLGLGGTVINTAVTGGI